MYLVWKTVETKNSYEHYVVSAEFTKTFVENFENVQKFQSYNLSEIRTDVSTQSTKNVSTLKVVFFCNESFSTNEVVVKDM